MTSHFVPIRAYVLLGGILNGSFTSVSIEIDYMFLEFIASSPDVMPSTQPIRWLPFRTEATTLGSAPYGS